MEKILNSAAIAALALLLAASCSVKQDRMQCLAPLTVHVDELAVSQENFPTKAVTPVGDYDGIKTITLAFYDPTANLVYDATQLRADASTYTAFGDFSLSLPFGIYTMVVIASGSEAPVVLNSITDASFADEAVSETFTYTEDILIADAAPRALTATLQRIITRLVIQSTDSRPEVAQKLRISFAHGGKAFDPISGFATTDSGFIHLFESLSEAGATTRSQTDFFLFDNDVSIDLTIETLDADDNVLSSKTVPAVPFQRNRVTVLTGSIYSASSTASFAVETGFLSDYNMAF